MIKTESNNWKIEVEESSHVADRTHLHIHTDDYKNSLNIHLGKDGTLHIMVHTHDEDDNHAKVSKRTYKHCSEDGIPFTSKHTDVSCKKTDLRLIKISK